MIYLSVLLKLSFSIMRKVSVYFMTIQLFFFLYFFRKILIFLFLESVKEPKYQIQVMEKLPGNGSTNRGSIDPSQTQIWKTNETGWIKRCATFLYGLNDNIAEEYHLHTTNTIFLKFPSFTQIQIYRQIIGVTANVMFIE